MKKPGWIVGRPMLLLIASLHGALTTGAENNNRIPVPDAAHLEAAEKLSRDIFGAEYQAAKDDESRSALAKKIVSAGLDAGAKPSEQYVLFRLAGEIAATAGDVETALRAVEEIDRRFRVDPLEMKTALFAQLLGKTRSAASHRSYLPRFGEVFEEAIVAERFEIAGSVARLATESATKARDNTSRKEIEERLKELDRLEKEFAAMKQALAVLDERPTDPEANLVVGRYRCFSKADWEAGLPMLALGSDPTLSGLAEQELVAPESADGQAELADAWWKYAENADGPVKEATRTRAGRWYHQALPGLSGLPKVKAERRLQELAKLGISDRRPIVGPTSRREPLVRPTSPRKYQPVNLLALIDPKKDNYRQGAKWSFNQGSLIATRRGWGQLPRVKVPYIPPDEYDLDLEVTRLAAVHTKGGQALRIGLAGGQNRFQVIVDGGMPFRTSICHVDVQNPESKDNPTVVTATVLSTGRRTKIRCEVRNEGVKVSADGKTLIDWRGGFDRISIDKAWAAPNGLPLHLGRGDKTALAVHSLVLTPISGPGRALRNGN